MSATDAEMHALRRENDYLKQRNAQLQADVTDISAEMQRLRQELERRGGPGVRLTPNPLTGGQ